MKSILTIAILLFVTGFSSRAQVKTVELDEVVIEAMPFEKYISGSKIEKSDSLEMSRLDNRTLANYLQQNSTVYIKEQGNAMLASVSFRGTGSSHTGVFWHGININSLTLGSTDFNAVPLFLFDNVAVQYGGASSLHGSDAIGGSIHLNMTPSWHKGSRIQFRQDFGSFGNVFSGVKVDVGNGKWESKTRVFNRLLKNNFTYNIQDRVGGNYEIVQQNAQVHNYGLTQEFNTKISHNDFLSLKAWYGKNAHQVQPMMVTHKAQDQHGDEIFEQNLRLVAEYERYFKSGFLTTGLGYVWDYQLFNESDRIETKRALGNLNYEWNLSDRTTVKAGANATHIVPEVWSYQEDLTEWRSDVYMSLKHNVITNWIVNLNARKTFVPFTHAPIAPSLSTSYALNRNHAMFIFRAQIERSYRVPTFNDRYWGEQGRPDLNSEHGYSMEIGHNFQYKMNGGRLELDVAGFYMNIDDWIAWKPAGSLWRPFNLKQVESSGLEFRGNVTQKFSDLDIEFGGMYAYNRAMLRKGISADDPAVGYQLPYTPVHRGGLYANIGYKDYRLSINNNFTGMRYGIDVLNEAVDRFLLTDIHLRKNIQLGQQLLSLEGQVLNVFDIEYQNVKRYAMPGRYYLMSINFFINN
jgi:vitamin B12 transporter